MDWFERLTGFREGPYAETRAKLKVDAERLRSQVNGRSYAIGRLELVSLGTLRARTKAALAAGSITVAALELLEGVIAQAFTGVGWHLDRLPIYTSRADEIWTGLVCSAVDEPPAPPGGTCLR